MPEYVGNYSIATANTLAGAEMLNFLHICIKQITAYAPSYSVGNFWFWCPVSSVVYE